MNHIKDLLYVWPWHECQRNRGYWLNCVSIPAFVDLKGLDLSDGSLERRKTFRHLENSLNPHWNSVDPEQPCWESCVQSISVVQPACFRFVSEHKVMWLILSVSFCSEQLYQRFERHTIGHKLFRGIDVISRTNKEKVGHFETHWCTFLFRVTEKIYTLIAPMAMTPIFPSVSPQHKRTPWNVWKLVVSQNLSFVLSSMRKRNSRKR